MYQRARKVQELIYDPETFSSLAEEQLEAYSVAMNALSLVDHKNAWMLLPITPDSVHEVGGYLVYTLCYLRISAPETPKTIKAYSRRPIFSWKIRHRNRPSR
jgi:hypothetical protein